jgi:hypothetical protein
MRKHKNQEEPWETPSLEWIHRVRSEHQAERLNHPMQPLLPKEAEKLAKKYGLKLARRSTAKR